MDGSTFKYITEIIDNMCIPRTVVHFISGKLIVRLTSILTGLVEFNQASISVVHFNLLNPNKPNWRSAVQINFPLRICDYSQHIEGKYVSLVVTSLSHYSWGLKLDHKLSENIQRAK